MTVPRSLFDDVRGPPLTLSRNSDPGTKRCTSCAEVKPIATFNRDKRKLSGYGSICLDCKKRGHSLKLASRHKPLADRFWEKVHKTDGCWLWTGSRNYWGYGKIYVGGKLRHGMAHRVSYELTHGEIPDDLQVLHRCDNPACVRPDHLFLGTQADNLDDAVMKGRIANQFPLELVDAILDDLRNGLSQKDTARKHGVRQSSVWRIIQREKKSHRARSTDPITSALAAEQIDDVVAELQAWAAACVRQTPGRTQRELGVLYCPTDPRRIGRRLAEIEKLGLVRRGDVRPCTISGRSAETWFPVEPAGGNHVPT